ncbi:MAG: Crp/Fnr family transcriptional regulator [Sulfurovaceae bacterium]|nr:Crp/Fnr family transcriptional regulator [Sulfurovaceae bacterium]MDD5548368.1 Crp/Fnr family transcriptional regulator [Sulfurovaceae bacterium]
MKINDIELFKILPEHELIYITQFTKIFYKNKNDTIFLEGEKPDYLHILLNGTAKVYRVDNKGNELLLHNFKAQSLIAELANLENMHFPASCKMITDGYIAKIRFQNFQDLMQRNPQLSVKVISSLTKKMKFLDTVIQQNLLLSSQAKIASFIYENEDIFIAQKQHQVASMLFITPETLSRNLKKFKDYGILENNKNKFTIIDREKLKEFF